MNTKQVLIAIAITAAMSATAVMAQNAAAPASSAPAATAAADQGSGHKGKRPMKFEDRKAKKLQNLEKAAAKIQQKQACAEAATDNASLDKCFPKRGKGKGGWKKRSKGGDSKADTGAAPDTAPAPADK